MKNQTLALTLFAAATLIVACDQEPTAKQQIDNIKADAKEAAQDMKDYTYAQKAEFTAKMEANLAELNKDLDKLEAKIEKSSDAVKADAKPKFEALRGQVAKLNKQLDEAKNATESTWGDVKAGFKKGYNDVKDGFNQARQWVSDKIAP